MMHSCLPQGWSIRAHMHFWATWHLLRSVTTNTGMQKGWVLTGLVLSSSTLSPAVRSQDLYR